MSGFVLHPDALADLEEISTTGAIRALWQQSCAEESKPQQSDSQKSLQGARQ